MVKNTGVVRFLGFVIVWVLVSPLNLLAQHTTNDWTVLGEGRDTLLHTYLIDQARLQFEKRRRAVEETLVSADDARERLRRLAATYRQMLGPFPEKTPLEPIVTGIIRADGYRIEKVAFQSRPNFHVTANLYVPTDRPGPFPGVLMLCGHSNNGKASDAYQRMSILLAKNGFVVLIVDPISQGERYQFLEETGQPATRGGTLDHTLLDVGARLVGTSTVAYELWDNIRSLDYLTSRPEVNATRIGVTGNSGGGTQTTFLMGLDDRIDVAAPSCFIMTREKLFDTIGPQDGCQHLAGEGLHGIDHADYVSLFAPRPVLILAAKQDFFDFGGTQEAFQETRRLFSSLGIPDRVDLFSYDDEHGFSRPRRQAAVQWMRRWLLDDPAPVLEGELTVQGETDLLVTPTGQVVSAWDHETTVQAITLERARTLASDRKKFRENSSGDVFLEKVKMLIGLRDDLGNVEVEVSDVERSGRIKREQIVIRRENEVPVPGIVFSPDQQDGPFPAVLYVDGRGKHVDAGPDSPIERLVRQGHIVFSIDVRGFGETTDDPEKNRYVDGSQREYRTAMIAMHIGRPLLGQRVEDVMAALEIIKRRDDVDAGRIRLIGVEQAGPVALHAAVLDETIQETTVQNSLTSWLEILTSPVTRHQLSHIVPSALLWYDLTDLVAQIEPRKISVIE